MLCLLAFLTILAGCGGSRQSDQQTVRGDGFRYLAPQAWMVVREGNSTAAKNGLVDRIEVLRFRLEKPYRVALFPAVSRELDGVIAKIAKQLSGRVVVRETAQLAGRKVRSYRIEYSGRSEEIAFVLDGQTEYELLCRRPAAQPDTSCGAFFASFALD